MRKFTYIFILLLAFSCEEDIVEITEEEDKELKVDSVNFPKLLLGNEIMFTVKGEKLPKGLKFVLEDLINVVEVSNGNDSIRYFTGIPSVSLGSKNGYIQDVSNGRILYDFEANFEENPYTFIGNLSLKTQVELDAFNYKHVTGKLTVGACNFGYDKIKNVSNLKILESVGSLTLCNNWNLNSLEGLENLTYIDNRLLITNNKKLISLNGLNNLSNVKDLRIDNSDALINLKGLDNLFLRGYLSIINNNALKSLEGLENLKTVHDLVIWQNSSIESLKGLNNLKTVRGSVRIAVTNVLTTLEGLNNLESIANWIEIYINKSLTSLKGLEKLNYIGDKLVIFNNENLTSLNYLENLTTIDDNFLFSIKNNKSLTSLCGIRQIITSGALNESYYKVEENKYNPTYEQMKKEGSGGCKE